MVRRGNVHRRNRLRSPHPRGDGPEKDRNKTKQEAFSPPAWGWSELCLGDSCLHAVLPTRVGMVRGLRNRVWASVRSPHPRGDGPLLRQSKRRHTRFSPPAWGWSGTRRIVFQPLRVLPTRVGMALFGFMAILELKTRRHQNGVAPCRSQNNANLPGLKGQIFGKNLAIDHSVAEYCRVLHREGVGRCRDRNPLIKKGFPDGKPWKIGCGDRI